MARMNHFLPGVMRRTLASTLTAAMMLSGTAFAPITAKAAESGVMDVFTASPKDVAVNTAALPSNVYEGANAKGKGMDTLWDGMLCLPDGSVEVGLYRMVPGVGTASGSSNDDETDEDGESVAANNATDPAYHYGVPYRLYYFENGKAVLADKENPPTNASKYTKAIDENLWFELGDMGELNTTGLAAVNLSMLYGYTHTSNGNSVVFDDLMEVYVTLNGTDWLGPVGIRSTQLLGGGWLNKANSLDGLFYRIETENLLDIEGVEAGDTIKGIKVMPYGQKHITTGKFSLNKLQVNTYASQEEFDRVPGGKPTYNVGGDVLRQIAVEEALRTASKPWKAKTDVITYFGDGPTTRTYQAGVTFHGPTYERVVDSTRELFFSQIDGEDWTGGTSMYDKKDSVYGMDCQTFVFNAISRVSRTYAWSTRHILGASRTSLVRDAELEFQPHPYFTDTDIIDWNSANNYQALYRSYAKAQPGDITGYYGKSGTHVRVVTNVHVEYNADGTVNPYNSYINCAHSASDIRYYYQASNGNTQGTNDRLYVTGDTYAKAMAKLPTGAKFLYAATAREDSKHTFDSLRKDGSVIYTLDEYATGLVEQEKVEAVLGSKQMGQHFTDGGANIAISSNYRIISYEVSLDKADKSKNYYNPGRQYVMDSYTVALNHRDNDLDTALRNLPAGDYTLTLEVDSGPFTKLGQDTVPQAVKKFDFTVAENRTTVDPTDGDVFFAPGTVKAGTTVAAYVIDTAAGNTSYAVGQKVFVNVPADAKGATGAVTATRGRFWEMNGETFEVILGAYSAKYKYGYHDVISNLEGSKITIHQTSGHTSTNYSCGYHFGESCGAPTASTRRYECKAAQNFSNATKVIDLRFDVLTGKADAVSTVPKVYELTSAGDAVINTYVSKGSSGSSNTTADVIIVLDSNPFVDFDALKQNHTVVTDEAVEPTCTDTGLTEGKHCSVCGEVLVAQEEIAATGHTEVVDEAVAPTCTATGLTAGKHCSVCGEKLVAQTVVDALGHTVVVDEAVPPTCTDTGLTEGKHCSVCDEVLVAQEEVSSAGHKDGTGDGKCDTCGKELSVSVTVTTKIDDTVSGTKEYEYSAGESVTLTLAADMGYAVVGSLSDDADTTPVISAMPGTGYKLLQLLVNGEDKTEEVVDGKYFTFTVVDDTEIRVVFKEKVEAVNIYTENMILGNSLAMNFYVLPSSVDPSKDYYIQVTKTYADGREDVVKRYYEEDWEEYKGTYYRVTFAGIAAKEMNDDIRVQVFYTDDTPAGEVYTSSPRIYAEKMLKTEEYSSGKWATLFVDMLNYGASAQEHFGYDAEYLANANLTAEQQELASGEVTLDTVERGGGEYFFASTLSLENNIALNLYLANMSAGMYATVNFTDHYGTAHTKTVEFEEMTEDTKHGTGCHILSVRELAVADCEAMVTVTVHDTQDVVVDTIVESVVTYLYIMQEGNSDDALYMNALKFIASAKNSV